MNKHPILALCGFAFILAASGAAFAAPPAPAPVYNWTGWYAGGNVGASFGNVKTDFNASPVSILEANGPTVFTITTPALSVSDREYPSGFMGGGQIGYNWQFSPIWVGGGLRPIFRVPSKGITKRFPLASPLPESVALVRIVSPYF